MNKHKCYFLEQVPPLHKQLRSLPTGSSDYLKKYVYWQYEELVNTTYTYTASTPAIFARMTFSYMKDLQSGFAHKLII